jgi:transcriptional regulator with XRE-family HTH domain
MGKRLYTKRREKLRALLKQVRLNASMTQGQLGLKLGRHQSYVSDYERGHRRLDWVAVEEALNACECDIVTFAMNYAAATCSLEEE